MPQFLRSIGVRIASYTLDSTQPPRCKLSSYATISRFWHVETEKRTFKLLKVYFGEDADTVRGFYNKRRLSYVSNVQIFPDSDTINWADFLFDWLNDRDAHVKAIASGAEFQGHLATAWQCLASLSWPDITARVRQSMRQSFMDIHWRYGLRSRRWMTGTRACMLKPTRILRYIGQFSPAIST